MMKKNFGIDKTMQLSIGIVTLNAKYIHTSLSLRYLRNAARLAGFHNVWIEEFVISQPVWKIAAEIYARRPDVLGVSVYIWNRQQSFELIERLQKQMPSLEIVIGGPEVSFEPKLPDQYTLISGEGESKWVDFLNHKKDGNPPTQETLVRWNTYGTDLPQLIAPYLPEDTEKIKNRIAYLETSRGCPYLCSFCLSALDKKVRYFDQAVTYGQIEQLVNAGVKRIKFVDRTFNLKPGRMKELMQWLTRFQGASFHFEVVADILTPDIMAFLATVPEGMFQFEMGIQTTNAKTQETIHRKQDKIRLFDAVRELIRQNKIHCHCDLIFGLPGETLEHLLKSFSDVLTLKPHELQLGFLKFLPGAPIQSDIESHGYQFQSSPPYELICNKDLSAGDVIYLKKFTEIFDLFYNSKRFRFSMDHLLENWDSVALFMRLLQYMEENNLLFQSHSLEDQYKIFYDAFSLGENSLQFDLLRLDYLYAQRVYHFPRFLMTANAETAKFKIDTWQGDRKTPLIPFNHEIHLNLGRVNLTPVAKPNLYAIAHPKGDSGYIQSPSIHLAAD